MSNTGAGWGYEMTQAELTRKDEFYSIYWKEYNAVKNGMNSELKEFDMIGPNAPQDVKDAWMEAAKEVNANGLGIKKNGMLSHISQMMVQRLNKQMNGEGDVDNIDILGNTTDSAIQATKQALYNLDHPLEYVPKSIEVQRACMKEREFYVAFLERLEKL